MLRCMREPAGEIRRYQPRDREAVRAICREARRFFERLGFHPMGRSPAFKPPASLWRPEWKVVYGRVV